MCLLSIIIALNHIIQSNLENPDKFIHLFKIDNNDIEEVVCCDDELAVVNHMTGDEIKKMLF